MQQEKLIRSGASVFICFTIVWWIHLQCHFCPFWHFGPYWLGMKVICWNAWYHTSGWCNFVLPFYISTWCSSMSVYCLGTGWIFTSHGSHWSLPSVVPCFVWRFLYARFVVSAREGCAAPHVVCMLWLLQNLSEMDYGLNDGLWGFDIRFVNDLRFCITYILSSVHKANRVPFCLVLSPVLPHSTNLFKIVNCKVGAS